MSSAAGKRANSSVSCEKQRDEQSAAHWTPRCNCFETLREAGGGRFHGPVIDPDVRRNVRSLTPKCWAGRLAPVIASILRPANGERQRFGLSQKRPYSIMQIILICRKSAMVDLATWLREQLNRRAVLAGGLAAAGTSALGATGALGQTDHSAHSATPAVDAPNAASDHANAHGAMVTVGEVDSARNGFDPTAMLTDWETGSVSTLANGADAADLRDRRRGQGDRDRAGPHVPGLDVQWPRSRTDAARDGRRPPPDRLQELRLAPAFHAFPRHPRSPHGRRSGRRHGRSGRRIRLRIRRQALRLPPLSLPRFAAETAPAQGNVRRLHHRSRSCPPSRTCRCRPLTPARHSRRTATGRNSSW